MPRLILIQTILFFLPLAVVLALNGVRAVPVRLTPVRIVGLLTGGVLLVIASFVVLASFGGGTDPASYRPARFENGVLVPAEVR